MAFDHLLVGTATWVLLLAAAWLAVLLTAVAIEALSQGRLRATRLTGAPPWLRAPLLALAVGTLGAVGLGSPTAGASDTSGHPVGARALVGLPLPDRQVGATVAAGPEDVVVTVRPGDSLWRIAERRTPGASPAAVVAAVRALHHHNAEVIGPDADLLHPGQRLRIPPRTPPSPPTTPDHQERR